MPGSPGVVPRLTDSMCDLGRVPDGSARRNARCEHVHLARNRWPGEGAAHVPVSHASRLPATAIHSSRPSIGMS